ncbi:MAG: hypothetical protein A2Y33_02755 [Spirochaetes bacterium GWF1_51_8]|nr:MAG: hypothetical protein A2Y33_02755 [Spirochaetes bacterium GWF1_51_8]
MDEKTRKEMGEIAGLVSTTWKGLALTAGVTAGFFEKLSPTEPRTAKQISDLLNFDIKKVEMWLYFAVSNSFVEQTPDGYTLTSLGSFFASSSPVKDLFGMIQITSYYMNAALNSSETFKEKLSLEALTEGKVSRNYQPKVSDNLSASLIDNLKQNDLGETDTLMDIGTGNGSFLRIIHNAMPKMSLTGIDTNLFSIELGRKENNRLGISDKIQLLIGDAREDLGDYKDGSFDWITCINVFHFYPVDEREQLVRELIRIAKKGVFTTEAILEMAPMMSSANSLMAILWNDFSGFFRQAEVDEIDKMVTKNFSNCKITKTPIVQGGGHLVAILKK